jgi:hypothetical protein
MRDVLIGPDGAGARGGPASNQNDPKLAGKRVLPLLVGEKVLESA